MLEFAYGTVHLLVGVVGHKGNAHKGVGGSTCGRDNGVDEHTLFKGTGCDDEGLFQIAYIEGNDGAFCVANLKTFLLEALQGIARNIPESFQTLGLCLEDA